MTIPKEAESITIATITKKMSRGFAHLWGHWSSSRRRFSEMMVISVTSKMSGAAIRPGTSSMYRAEANRNAVEITEAMRAMPGVFTAR